MEGLIGRLKPQISKLKNHVDIPHLSPKALTIIGLGAVAITACSKADLGPVVGIATIFSLIILPVAFWLARR